MRVITRQLAKEILFSSGFVLIALVALFAFFDLVGQLDDVADGRTIMQAFTLTAFTLPARIYEVMPLAALLASVYTMSRWAATSEFTCLRVAGMSPVTLALSLMLPGIILVGITYTFGEFIAPAASRYAAEVKSISNNQTTRTARGYSSGVWVRDVTTGELLPELRKIPFRTVISMEVIEHLHSPRTFAAFVRSILEANGGGRFILTTPYHGYLKNLSIALAGKADRHYSALWEGGHIKFWSRRTLAILLREAGFRNMAFTGAGRIPYLWRHMVFSAETPAAAEVRACDPAAEP